MNIKRDHARALGTWICAAASLILTNRAADYLTPADVVLPTETASQQIVAQSATKSTLRWAGLDFFPHAGVTSMFDDNIVISHTQPMSDVEWTLSPGLTIAAGDIASYLPGPVTMDQIRGLLSSSLEDDNSHPRRYLGLDYTPGVNIFTEHSQYDNVDELARLSAGYAFGHLSLSLDQDYVHMAVKDNAVGTLLVTDTYKTDIRAHYEVNDRSSFDVDGRYLLYAYADPLYQGYQEFRNEDWYNRFVGTRLNLGFGAAFGLVYPEASANQVYEQALVRAVYHITGKLDLRPALGVEWREFSQGGGSAVYPIFSLAAIYHPREWTIITLEGHRRDQPSYSANENYSDIGFSAGLRQMVRGRLAVSLIAGYDQVNYTTVGGSTSLRTDDNLTGRLSLDYDLNSRWTTSLFYLRRQDNSSLPNYSYKDNMVGARVAWRF
jgi:hypothetical protein